MNVLKMSATWTVGKLVALLPDWLFRLIAPKRFRYSPDQIPPPPIAPKSEVRLYICPVNWAGQAWQWARAAEQYLPDVGAVTMSYQFGNELGFDVDQSVPVGAYLGSSKWQREQKLAVTQGFTHVLVEGGKNPFGRVLDQSIGYQLKQLQNEGLKIALLFHGTDIRLPSRHAAANQLSPFGSGSQLPLKMLERQAVANRKLANILSAQVFVSTPDLLIDVPYANWLPVVVDVEKWSGGNLPLESKTPVVVHAPSNSAIKGSDLIEEAMQNLDCEGLIEYRHLSKIPAAEMPNHIRAADIVLDQFRIGAYGVAAVEAMAAGRVVIAHVTDSSRQKIQERTGFKLPIVEATAHDLKSVIREVIAERSQSQKIALAGREYAIRVHDGKFSANILKPFLLN